MWDLLVGGEELAAVCAPAAFTMGFNHGSRRPVLDGGKDAQREKIGFRCPTTPTVRFSGATVPDDHVIGGVGGAEALLQKTLDYIRFGGACVILGIAVGALGEAVPWLESREVGLGEPLIAKSHVQLELGEIYAEIQAVRLALWRAADLLHAGRPCSTGTPLADLPDYLAPHRLERFPRLALRLASFKTRSDPRFYERYFGTYGLSSLVKRGFGPSAGHGVANTGSSLFSSSIAERLVVHDGVAGARLTMPMMVVVDFYLLDGHDMLDAMAYLRNLIERPAAIGLEAPVSSAPS